MKKKVAWIGTIITLIIFSSFFIVGLYSNRLWLIIISSILIFIYLIALAILIIDYFQTKDIDKVKINVRYVKTK